MDIKKISEAFRILFGSFTSPLPITEDDVESVRTIKQVWSIECLLGVRCPRCNALGSVSKLSFDYQSDIRLSLAPGQQDPDFSRRNSLFGFIGSGRVLKPEFNPLGSDHVPIEVSIANQEEVSRHRTPWFCAQCSTSLQTIEFVPQLCKDRNS